MWYMEHDDLETETETGSEAETRVDAGEEGMNTSDTEDRFPSHVFSGQRDAQSQKHYTQLLLGQLESATL